METVTRISLLLLSITFATTVGSIIIVNGWNAKVEYSQWIVQSPLLLQETGISERFGLLERITACVGRSIVCKLQCTE